MWPRSLRFILHISSPTPGIISHFSEEPWFLLLANGMNIDWILKARIAFYASLYHLHLALCFIYNRPSTNVKYIFIFLPSLGSTQLKYHFLHEVFFGFFSCLNSLTSVALLQIQFKCYTTWTWTWTRQALQFFWILITYKLVSTLHYLILFMC